MSQDTNYTKYTVGPFKARPLVPRVWGPASMVSGHLAPLAQIPSGGGWPNPIIRKPFTMYGVILRAPQRVNVVTGIPARPQTAPARKIAHTLYR